MASPTRKLTKAEDEAVTQRLFYAQSERSRTLEEKRQQTLGQSGFKQDPLTEEGTRSLVTRIYDNQIDRKKQTAEKNQAKREALAAPTKTIGESEMSEMVQRMYYQQKEKTVKMNDSLAKKYQPAPVSRRLNKEEEKASASRLADGFREKKQETREKLFDKYIAPMEPEKKTIDKAGVKAMADRLCTTKS
jgi:hypothetical protein